jgi:hypothetical protein
MTLPQPPLVMSEGMLDKARLVLRRRLAGTARAMIRGALMILVIGLGAEAALAEPFEISREMIEAAKPLRVAITSMASTDMGVRVVAFAFDTVEIANFLRQLETAGATNIRLQNMRPELVCEHRVMRAEFEIVGDARRVIEVSPSRDQLLALLGARQGKAKCIPQLPL